MVIDRFNGDDESYILYLLEVYKRISNKQLCQELNLSTSTAVSYTHLDLYKRQTIWWTAYT